MRTRLRFQKGNDFEKHVDSWLGKQLSQRWKENLLETQDAIATSTEGIRKPDFAYRDEDISGQYKWIGDAKAYDYLGNLDKRQIRGFIEEASRTTLKLLIIFVPSRMGAKLPADLLKEAKDADVTFNIKEVPWEPDLDPNFQRI